MDASLRAVYEAVSNAASLTDAFKAFVAAATEVVAFDGASFALLEPDGPVVAASTGTVDGYDVVEHAVVVAGEPRARLRFSAERVFTDEDRMFLADVAAVAGSALYAVARLEEEQASAQRLREIDQLKNEFVGVVAHDLRSPMTVIAGYVDTVLIRWDDLDDEAKRDLLAVASRNTKRLSNLVEDVLQVARIESGEFPYDIAPFDLGRLVRRTVDEMNAAKPGRPVVADVPPGLLAALGDEDRLWRVLTNLISNAQKFSPEGEPVVVTARAAGESVEVAVTDCGPGIPEEDLPRLFGKFSRLGQPTGSEKGTGLGLYISKALIEAQGGKIEADSRVGRGTTLRFTVPADRR